jgi:hypothetical protein
VSLAKRAVSAGLSFALAACADTAVTGEVGSRHNPAHKANKNRSVSVLLNRFLF